MKFVFVVAILWSASSCQADITTDMKAELDEVKATLTTIQAALNAIQAVVSLSAREHLESAVDDRVSEKFVRTSTCASGTAAASLPLGDVQAVPSGVSGPARCALYCKDLAGCTGYNFRSVPLSDGTQCQLYTATPAAYSVVANCQYYKATDLEMGCLSTFSFNQILLQQNIGGTTFFQRTWAEFKVGFGDVAGNYWIGNERIHELTKDGRYKLRVDIQAKTNSQWYYEEYNTFMVGDETTNYKLTIADPSGTAGDSMSYINGAKFCTKDKDTTGGCLAAVDQGNGGGFWYIACGLADLNTPKEGQWGFLWNTLPGTTDRKLLVSRMTLVQH